MNRYSSNIVHIGSIVASIGLLMGTSACDAKVISLDPPISSEGGAAVDEGSIDGGVSSVDGGSAAPSLALAGTLRIEDLSTAQATTLCNWLIADALAVAGVSAAIASSGPTCADGPSYDLGCSGVISPVDGQPHLLYRPVLPTGTCIANLQHSACQGTISDLEACVAEGDSIHALESAGAADIYVVCPKEESACLPFIGATGCQETVYQSSPGVVTSSTTSVLAVPIAPGATCAETTDGGLDAGEDASADAQ